MALLVGLPVDLGLVGAAWIGYNLRSGRSPKVVGDDVTDTPQAWQDRPCSCAIAVLARDRVDPQRQAERINRRVQLVVRPPRERPIAAA